jgi:hypothetical protein
MVLFYHVILCDAVTLLCEDDGDQPGLVVFAPGNFACGLWVDEGWG